MRIEVIKERDGVARLRDEWCALQHRCPDATPYQTWEWNEAWWRHFGQRKMPRLLLFRAEPAGELVGIAPLYTSRHLGTPVRRLAWMGTGPSDYLGPIALPDYADAVADGLRAFLAAGLRGWDMADLQQLRPLSPLLADIAEPTDLDTQYALPMEPCPYLTLTPTWETLAPRLGKKLRSNLGYYERLLHKTFPDARHFLADVETLDAGMTALFALHQSRWNARWLPGVLGSPRVQAFHREVAARFLEQGWLRLHLLHLDGEIQSALYCFAFGGRTLYYLGGFAPELGKYSLGTLLTGWAIRQAIEEGHSEFDFLRGSEPYKYRWTSEERFNSRLLILRQREKFGAVGELPGKAGYALNRMERYVEHRAKAFLEKRGRKEGAKPVGTEEAAKPSSEQLPANASPFVHAVVRFRARRRAQTK